MNDCISIGCKRTNIFNTSSINSSGFEIENKQQQKRKPATLWNGGPDFTVDYSLCSSALVKHYVGMENSSIWPTHSNIRLGGTLGRPSCYHPEMTENKCKIISINSRSSWKRKNNKSSICEHCGKDGKCLILGYRFFVITLLLGPWRSWEKVKSLSKDIDTAKINKHFHFGGFGTKKFANIDRSFTE